MPYYACVTLRGHQSFPPVVIHLTFVQHNLRTSHSGKVALCNSEMERTIYAKFLQKRNSINITWTCHLNVFPSGKRCDICLAIWKEISKNMTLWHNSYETTSLFLQIVRQSFFEAVIEPSRSFHRGRPLPLQNGNPLNILEFCTLRRLLFCLIL